MAEKIMVSNNGGETFFGFRTPHVAIARTKNEYPQSGFHFN
jgi:hypothetical protein